LGPTAAGGPEAADAPAEAVRPAKEKKKPKNIIATHLTIRYHHQPSANTHHHTTPTVAKTTTRIPHAYRPWRGVGLTCSWLPSPPCPPSIMVQKRASQRSLGG
jgi:hypothetical protein